MGNAQNSIRNTLLLLLFLVASNAYGQSTSNEINTQQIRKKVYQELDSLFWVSTTRHFLDKPPQHFLFSIRFDLDSAGSIIDVLHSENMHEAFLQSFDGIRRNVRKDLFVNMQIPNSSIILPVFIFTTATPNYHATLSDIKAIWEYGTTNTAPASTTILPPIYDATSKLHVTLKIDESELDDTPKKLQKKLPDHD